LITLSGMRSAKDPKIILQMPASMLEEVDDFRFANRIDSRAEAIRQLVQRSLDAVARTAPSPKRPARKTA
jgi:metal-responsive CopG/Arc/MetJ family transcriptional regulator